MRFGVLLFPTDETIDPATLAGAAETRGFDSLWFPDHTHVPVHRQTPWPGGGELPREYYRLHDPLIALASAAAATTQLQIATGVLLLAQRDPIVTAKALSSLDVLSGGRLVVGVGAGWSREEVEHHGTAAADRFAVLDERVAAMKAIWTRDEATFHGTHVKFDPIFSWPKPVQTPHPPIAVGGNSEGALRRVVAYGDEWVPATGLGIESLSAQIQRLGRMLAEAGREPVPVTLYGAPPDAAAVRALQDVGVTRCLFGLPPAPADVVLPVLDRLAAVAASFA